MSQQINLFNPAFRKQRLMLSTVTVVQCLAVTLVTLSAFQFYLQQQLNGLNEELSTAQSLLKAQRSYADRLTGDSAVRKKDTVLEAEIAKLEAELKLGRESMDALITGAIGSQQGFAEYLRAFSRQSLNGLWLTGFTIAGSGEIAIHGRVTNPELVPNYIQRLNQEKVLQGRSFATLEMRQPRPAPAEAGQKGKEEKKTPRYLEFSLTTSEPAAGSTVAARTERAQ